MDYAAGKRKLARPPFSNPLIGQFARYKPAPRTLIVKRGFLTIRQPPLLFWPRTARVCSRRRHWHSAHCPSHPRRTHRPLYPPLLAKPASDLLDNMHHGSIPIALATLIINGEIRSFSSATLPAASLPTPQPRHPHPTGSLHRRHRGNEHSPPAHCLHPHRRHHGTRGPMPAASSAPPHCT